jgi:hypothetical protein
MGTCIWKPMSWMQHDALPPVTNLTPPPYAMMSTLRCHLTAP